MERAKLSDVCLRIYSGGTPSTSCSEYWDGTFPWLSSGETRDNFIVRSEKYITQTGIDNSTTKFAPRGATIIASAGEGKTRGQCSYLLFDAYVNQSLIVLIADETKVLKEYLYYYLKSKYNDIRSLSNATGVRGSLSCFLIGEMIIEHPTLQEQQKIVDILYGLDKQIQRNKMMVHKLQVLGNTIYSKQIKSIIDFETIDLQKIKTGKEDANFATCNGKYKFFTCAENVLSCNKNTFEGKSILIAGNGNFNVKFVDGKFNAYQRVYVISEDKKYGNLYYTCYYNISALSKNANGSIIKFLTLDMLKNIQIPILDDNTNQVLNDIVLKIYKISSENEKLEELKEKLLPLLINGQLSI